MPLFVGGGGSEHFFSHKGGAGDLKFAIGQKVPNVAARETQAWIFSYQKLNTGRGYLPGYGYDGYRLYSIIPKERCCHYCGTVYTEEVIKCPACGAPTEEITDE